MDLIESIKKHEGYVGIVYKDSLGIDTIGYGFAIKDLELDKDICDIILERKLKDLESRVKLKFGWYPFMPKTIQNVVMEMCYQLGVTGFSKFVKTITYLKDKDFVIQELINYDRDLGQLGEIRDKLKIEFERCQLVKYFS